MTRNEVLEWLESRRPLMVGSERKVNSEVTVKINVSPSPRGRVGTATMSSIIGSSAKSPSPHGRVGTVSIQDKPTKICQSPSPHGRVGTVYRRWQQLQKRASPSPHSRVGTRKVFREMIERALHSPSPHGRVGTCSNALSPCLRLIN